MPDDLTINGASSAPSDNSWAAAFADAPAEQGTPTEVVTPPVQTDGSPEIANAAPAPTDDIDTYIAQLPLHQQDRFREVIKQKNDLKTQADGYAAQLAEYTKWDRSIDHLKKEGIDGDETFLNRLTEFDEQSFRGQLISELQPRINNGKPDSLTPQAAKELFEARLTNRKAQENAKIVAEVRRDQQVDAVKATYPMADIEDVIERHGRDTSKSIGALMKESHEREQAREDRIRTRVLYEQEQAKKKPAGGLSGEAPPPLGKVSSSWADVL